MSGCLIWRLDKKTRSNVYGKGSVIKVFQFRRREKTGGFSRGGRGAFIHWGGFQFGRREITGASVDWGKVPSFIGVVSSLDDVK